MGKIIKLSPIKGDYECRVIGFYFDNTIEDMVKKSQEFIDKCAKFEKRKRIINKLLEKNQDLSIFLFIFVSLKNKLK